MAKRWIGDKGMLTLAYRGGNKKIWAHEVCENDEFNIEWGTTETLTHKPCLDNKKGRGEVIGYYAAAILPNDEVAFCYMTKAEVEAHGRRFAPSFGSGPWQTDFGEMAKKTCAKQLFKWLPKSTELAQAIARDEAIIKADESRVDMAENIMEAETISVDEYEEIGSTEAQA